jgi:molybdopterin-containing oxidoreductase family membrane subunit
MQEAPIRDPLIIGKKSYGEIDDDVISPIEQRASLSWYIGFTLSAIIALMGVLCIGYTIYKGIGVWGLNKTIGWGFAITNFVWWVGIGHAGTLISAILLLFRQSWRNSINRSAEAMTLFAVVCAGLFPIIHMGRPWNAFWVFPVPNDFGPLWVNFNSPLLWDVFAISTYFTVSLVFWYIGLIPDLATMRDRAKTKLRWFTLNFFSFGWTGSAMSWVRFETVTLILAGLATPLVLSVHTIVSFDFAMSIVPGWHTTIFPPYFVAGAIYSGFAMVLTLLIIARKTMKLESYITMNHLDAMAKVTLLTGLMVGFSYITELFVAWYSGNPFEQYAFYNRAFGPYGWSYWVLLFCNLVVPQMLWSRKVRYNTALLWAISIVVNIGMWFERFVIIATSLHRDFLPSSWAMYYPSWVEVGIYVGTLGIFFTLFFLFIRFLPSVAIAEVKAFKKTTQKGKPIGALNGREIPSDVEFDYTEEDYKQDWREAEEASTKE